MVEIAGGRGQLAEYLMLEHDIPVTLIEPKPMRLNTTSRKRCRKWFRSKNLEIPENLNYDNFSGLSNEVKSKFKKIKPKTMGQALRIDGITPAAVYILLSHIKRKSIKHIA